MTPERLIEFVKLARQMRGMQREYRRTIDSRLRHRLPLVEEEFDRETELLLSALEDDAIRGALVKLFGPDGAELIESVEIVREGGAA